HPRAISGDARRAGLADSAALGRAHLRPARQQPEARAQGVHGAGGRSTAFELRQLRQRGRLHRGLGGGESRRPAACRCGRLGRGEGSMNILGPDSLVFGVDDVESCIRYLSDYGLMPCDVSPQGARFEALDATSVVIRRRDDPTLPTPLETGTMLRKTIYG